MMRRRVIYIEDETWNAVAETAKREGTTASDYIRRRLAEDVRPSKDAPRALSPHEILSRANRGKG